MSETTGRTTYVLHYDTEVYLVGTKEECEADKAARGINGSYYKVNTISDYGDACNDYGYEYGYATGYEHASAGCE